ncbi:hypothetical protein EVAR_97589_1 [Eumeta japonica]|uniref:Uncharacterized protein n=1 Tax=Eumeta variegata TaxID=151549 RepID=A0A4C1XKQ1_EUMVA|nr:hypothetical protein EVAR_97589_1 [Eumeta japonica]
MSVDTRTFSFKTSQLRINDATPNGRPELMFYQAAGSMKRILVCSLVSIIRVAAGVGYTLCERPSTSGRTYDTYKSGTGKHNKTDTEVIGACAGRKVAGTDRNARENKKKTAKSMSDHGHVEFRSRYYKEVLQMEKTYSVTLFFVFTAQSRTLQTSSRSVHYERALLGVSLRVCAYAASLTKDGRRPSCANNGAQCEAGKRINC